MDFQSESESDYVSIQKTNLLRIEHHMADVCCHVLFENFTAHIISISGYNIADSAVESDFELYNCGSFCLGTVASLRKTGPTDHGPYGCISFKVNAENCFYITLHFAVQICGKNYHYIWLGDGENIKEARLAYNLGFISSDEREFLPKPTDFSNKIQYKGFLCEVTELVDGQKTQIKISLRTIIAKIRKTPFMDNGITKIQLFRENYYYSRIGYRVIFANFTGYELKSKLGNRNEYSFWGKSSCEANSVTALESYDSNRDNYYGSQIMQRIYTLEIGSTGLYLNFAFTFSAEHGLMMKSLISYLEQDLKIEESSLRKSSELIRLPTYTFAKFTVNSYCGHPDASWPDIVWELRFSDGDKPPKDNPDGNILKEDVNKAFKHYLQSDSSASDALAMQLIKLANYLKPNPALQLSDRTGYLSVLIPEVFSGISTVLALILVDRYGVSDSHQIVDKKKSIMTQLLKNFDISFNEEDDSQNNEAIYQKIICKHSPQYFISDDLSKKSTFLRAKSFSDTEFMNFMVACCYKIK